MIKHQTNVQEVNKQLSKINIDYVQIKIKKQYMYKFKKNTNNML
jgi:hypothetical protein